MATFKISIHTDSDAFTCHREMEVGRMLKELADDIEGGKDFSHYVTLFDYNGNDVGRAKPVED